MYSICKNILDIIENNVIKCVFLNKTYLSNSQFVFSQCISHLLLGNAPRYTFYHTIFNNIEYILAYAIHNITRRAPGPLVVKLVQQSRVSIFNIKYKSR